MELDAIKFSTDIILLIFYNFFSINLLPLISLINYESNDEINVQMS